MRILIVEDELPTAEDIQGLVEEILGERLTSARIETTLESALAYLSEHRIDVLLLDLSLNAEDGFEILKQVVSQSFQTIIISAHVDRAVTAFEHGVLDFIPKPYNKARLERAFKRLDDSSAAEGHAARFLCIRKHGEISVVPIQQVIFFKGANVYTELHLSDGRIELYDKVLKNLQGLLPLSYFRIHKSYLVDFRKIKRLKISRGGKYWAELDTGEVLPVGRQHIRQLKERLNLT